MYLEIFLADVAVIRVFSWKYLNFAGGRSAKYQKPCSIDYEYGWWCAPWSHDHGPLIIQETHHI